MYYDDFLFQAMLLAQEKLNLSQRGTDKDRSRSSTPMSASQKVQEDSIFSGFFKTKKHPVKTDLKLEPVSK
jgi:hypothetical protein